jgi:hypothetical protein
VGAAVPEGSRRPRHARRRVLPRLQPWKEVDHPRPGPARGREIARALAAKSDVLVENFKVGDLARHGLDYATLAKDFRAWSTARSPGSARTGPTATGPATTSWSRGSAG